MWIHIVVETHKVTFNNSISDREKKKKKAHGENGA